MKLSVCIIEKNEESVLERCLQGAALFADEIIVVDTGSSDRSREIALKYTDKIYDFEWIDDFSAARNAAFEKASGDYIMWLDADDVVDEENGAKLRKLKETYCGNEPWIMPYDRPEHGGVFYYIRAVKRRTDGKPYWKGIIHEQLMIDEPLVKVDILIRHGKKGEMNYERNIQIMQKLTDKDLENNFYLCCQCFLDCCLAGKKELASHYFSLCDDNGDFCEKCMDYLLICGVLAWHKKDEDVVRWVELAWSDFQRYPIQNDIMLYLLSDGLQAAKRLGDFQMAERMNNRVLELQPDNAAALKNRHLLRKIIERTELEDMKVFHSILSMFADNDE